MIDAARPSPWIKPLVHAWRELRLYRDLYRSCFEVLADLARELERERRSHQQTRARLRELMTGSPIDTDREALADDEQQVAA